MIDYQNTLVLKEEKGFLFRLMTHADIEAAAKVFTDSFQREIMVSYLGITSEDFLPFATAFCTQAVESKFGIVAEDLATGKVAGIAVMQDLITESEEDEEFDSLTKPLEPVFALLDEMLLKYIDAHQVFISGEAAIIYIIGVDAEFKRTKIGSTLTDTSLELIEEYGYKTVIGEATSYASQEMIRKYGFEDRFEVSYRRFELNGEFPFADMQQDNPVCKLMVKEL